ncbi:MAG: MBL fold metallo-hydrolase [Planctomycetota bacterium]
MLRIRIPLLTVLCAVLSTATLSADDRALSVYWVDVEGGAATLVVTGAGESILIDTGLPGSRDPSRIDDIATRVAGLTRIDHLVITHFDIDHFGGAVDLSRRIAIGKVYDPGIPGNHPFDRWPPSRFTRYRETFGDRRTIVKPGDRLPLADTLGDQLRIDCLVARQAFITPGAALLSSGGAGSPEGACIGHDVRSVDRSENRNSIVLVVQYRAFRFLDTGDLTWNLERQLVCPVNLAGKVDVLQSSHHGLDSSNNPVLYRATAPDVVVFNNGPTKGCMPNAFRTAKSTESVKAVYQLHRNLRSAESNTEDEFICNEKRRCEATHLELAVDKSGESYRIRVPSTGSEARYRTSAK